MLAHPADPSAVLDGVSVGTALEGDLLSEAGLEEIGSRELTEHVLRVPKLLLDHQLFRQTREREVGESVTDGKKTKNIDDF